MEMYLDTLQKRVSQGRPILCFNGKVPEFLNSRFKVIPSDVQLQQAEQVIAEQSNQEDLPTDATSVEEIVTEIDHASHKEIISLFTKDGETPYFTRRLLTKKGSLLWCGTSYHKQGPWTLYSQEERHLKALGITP
jgi:hypothetical protein